MQKLKGFSLPEVILVVAVIAVVSTISFRFLDRFLDRSKIEEERKVQSDIHRVINLYLKTNKALPLNETACDSGGNWHEKLAEYSGKYNKYQYCYDVWGKPRIYQALAKKKTYLGGAYGYNVYYVTVQSHGPDGSKAGANNVLVWSGITGANRFSLFDVGNTDDVITKYNSEDIALKLFKTSLERIEFLEKRLNRYSRSKTATAKSNEVLDYQLLKFVPKDGRGGDSASYYDQSNGADVESAVDQIAAVGSNEAMKATALAKTLGVPEVYGLDAITGKSMWYIANPGSNRLMPCAGARSSAPYYPAAIVMTQNGQKPNGC